MKILKSILILLVVVIIGIFGFSMTIDGKYDSSAQLSMNASPSTIQGIVSDLTTWENWGVWQLSDPTGDYNYSDPASGQGAWYTWAGDSMGSGKLTIMELGENSMATKVEFDGQGESNGYWKFEPREDGTTMVTWGMNGEMGAMGKAMFAIFMGTTDIDGSMDEMAGKDFTGGLANLKVIAENTEMASKIDVEETTVAALDYYSITETLKISEMDSMFFGRMFGELMGYLGPEAGANMTGMPFAIYHKWDPENDETTIEVAVAVNSDMEETERIKKGKTHEGNVLKAVKTGTYETEEEHNGLYAYLQLHGKEMIGSPWEIFATDPTVEEIVVEVYYPVK
ncbi:MAG: SRPBCC family protein [Schleiferiaceae bacterium]|nr:SRPBCC family protein [Schleiferiaceae bacterium]